METQAGPSASADAAALNRRGRRRGRRPAAGFQNRSATLVRAQAVVQAQECAIGQEQPQPGRALHRPEAGACCGGQRSARPRLQEVLLDGVVILRGHQRAEDLLRASIGRPLHIRREHACASDAPPKFSCQIEVDPVEFLQCCCDWTHWSPFTTDLAKEEPRCG
jgi:hypothetical protein